MTLPQDVRTPLVPDSEMHTESSINLIAGEKRKAGSDALSAPHDKKIATSDASIGLPESSIQEDGTPLWGSSASTELSENDEEEIVLVYNRCGGRERWTLAYDTAPGDFEALDDAVAKFYNPCDPEYITLHGRMKELQGSFERNAVARARSGKLGVEARFNGKLHVEARFNKMGRVTIAWYECDMIK